MSPLGGKSPFLASFPTNHKEIHHVDSHFGLLHFWLRSEPPSCSGSRSVRRFIMSLSTETKRFFEKVASKNFRLACNVYHALVSGQDITPEVRGQIREALRIAG